VETLNTSVLDYGVAQFVLPGQKESGDRHLICCGNAGLLIAAIDGLGHGEEAAHASNVAASILGREPDEPVISLLERCHEKLKLTRGVVLSLAHIDAVHGMMTWLGVGNVQGVLTRGGSKSGSVQELLLLRAGVVGSQLPPLQAAVLPVSRGDTLIFVTDGVRGEFASGLAALESPQRAADRILKNYGTGTDDALVLVARFTEIRG
jgi:negative regulator of sigma-B (phosphoserine phosphatase)